MTVTVALDEATADGDFEVPASSIIKVDNAPAVWRVSSEGALVAVPVKITQFATNSVRVQGDLSEGDRIVSAGAHKLDANVRVRTWETQR